MSPTTDRRAEVVASGPSSLRTLAAQVAGVGWIWAAGPHHERGDDLLSLAALDPAVLGQGRGILVVWSATAPGRYRLAQCQLWDLPRGRSREAASLAAARALVEGAR